MAERKLVLLGQSYLFLRFEKKDGPERFLLQAQTAQMATPLYSSLPRETLPCPTQSSDEDEA
jgi:hypothetical protein